MSAEAPASVGRSAGAPGTCADIIAEATAPGLFPHVATSATKELGMPGPARTCVWATASDFRVPSLILKLENVITLKMAMGPQTHRFGVRKQLVSQ